MIPSLVRFIYVFKVPTCDLNRTNATDVGLFSEAEFLVFTRHVNCKIRICFLEPAWHSAFSGLLRECGALWLLQFVDFWWLPVSVSLLYAYGMAQELDANNSWLLVIHFAKSVGMLVRQLMRQISFLAKCYLFKTWIFVHIYSSLSSVSNPYRLYGRTVYTPYINCVWLELRLVSSPFGELRPYIADFVKFVIRISIMIGNNFLYLFSFKREGSVQLHVPYRHFQELKLRSIVFHDATPIDFSFDKSFYCFWHLFLLEVCNWRIFNLLKNRKISEK